MSTPIALPQFTVQQYVEEAETPDVGVGGADINVQPLPIVATFTPNFTHAEVGSSTPPFTVYFDPVQGRVDTDGYLKGMNDEPLYYDNAGTRNPVPANASPVYTTSHVPDHWVDNTTGATIANPAGVVVWGVRLVCGATMFNLADPLTYRVDYTQGRVLLPSLRFQAPASDTTIDLSTVTRLPL